MKKEFKRKQRTYIESIENLRLYYENYTTEHLQRIYIILSKDTFFIGTPVVNVVLQILQSRKANMIISVSKVIINQLTEYVNL